MGRSEVVDARARRYRGTSPRIAGRVEGRQMHVDRRLLGWGLFFILVGGIPLAVRANLLDRDLVGQWPLLWPVLLIAWGIGLLLRGTPIDWIGGAVAAITFGIMGGGLLATGAGGLPIATGCASNASAVAFPDRNGNLDAAAQVNLEFNCGTLAVNAVEGAAWSLTGSDRDGSGPKVTSTSSLLSIQPDDGGGFPGTGRSAWNVSIPRSPSISLGLTLNAGDGTVDLSGASIASTTMTLNAGKVTFDLGTAKTVGDVNATVNAGAAALALPAGERDVNLSLNAGSLTVCLPAGAPVRVGWAGTLGSNNFSEAGLNRVDDTTWTSSGFDAQSAHTELHVSANAGSFELQFGGTCGA
jgi:hypothetical protein